MSRSRHSVRAGAAGLHSLAPLSHLLDALLLQNCEGPPPQTLTLPNIADYLYLGIVGTDLAYTLSFRGVHLLPASTTAILGLLSPLVATLAGWALLNQSLTSGQIIGAVIRLRRADRELLSPTFLYLLLGACGCWSR
jgi:drug/metabolite transporter (DMT)-like permease